MKRIVSMVGLGLLFASAVAAQTKIAGKMQCPKPEVVGTVEAGDEPGHRLTLEKNTCTWVCACQRHLGVHGGNWKADGD